MFCTLTSARWTSAQQLGQYHSKASSTSRGRTFSTTSPIDPAGRCGECLQWPGTSTTSPSRIGISRGLPSGGGGAEAIQVSLDTRLKPVLIGEDPLFVERLWERMFRADMGIRKQGIAAYALSALDIGLWDIAGKVAGLPLYQLWGAVTDCIPAYGSGGWARYSVEDLVGQAERYAGP